MIPDPDQPREGGSAAEPQGTRRSRSITSSRVLAILATACSVAAVIGARLHENNAKVAPSAQFLRHGASIFDTNDGVTSALELSSLTNRTVSAHTELVTHRGHSHNDALSAGFFTAPYISTCSSPINASSLIIWTSAVFDKELIAPWSRISQERTEDEDVERIVGEGGSRRLRLGCRKVQCPSLRDESIQEGGLIEAFRALLRDGLYDRVVQSFWSADQIEEGEPPEAVLHRGQYDCIVQSPWSADRIEGGGLSKISAVPPSSMGGEEKNSPANRSPRRRKGGT